MEHLIIGIDHGYGRMKTENSNFVSGMTESTAELPFSSNVLEYQGRFYSIGESRLPYKADKTEDADYYVLTLAAIAKEMQLAGVDTAGISIAAGTPLSRYGAEKQKLQSYLTQNKEVSFIWEGHPYQVKIYDAAVYAQGLSALAWWSAMEKKQADEMFILADLGSGTFDVSLITGNRPVSNKMFSFNIGVNRVYNAIKESYARQTGKSLEEPLIEKVIMGQPVRLKKECMDLINGELEKFTRDVYGYLKDAGFNLDTIPVYWCGGGALVMQKYGQLEAEMNEYILNPNANASGYVLTYRAMERKKKAAEPAAGAGKEGTRGKGRGKKGQHQ